MRSIMIHNLNKAHLSQGLFLRTRSLTFWQIFASWRETTKLFGNMDTCAHLEALNFQFSFKDVINLEIIHFQQFYDQNVN